MMMTTLAKYRLLVLLVAIVGVAGMVNLAHAQALSCSQFPPGGFQPIACDTTYQTTAAGVAVNTVAGAGLASNLALEFGLYAGPLFLLGIIFYMLMRIWEMWKK
jgi:hypothetical protein